MSKNNGTINWRVEDLEEDMKEVNKKLYEIMTNHLPHIALDIQRVETKVLSEVKGAKIEIRVMFAVNLVLATIVIVLSRILS